MFVSQARGTVSGSQPDCGLPQGENCISFTFRSLSVLSFINREGCVLNGHGICDFTLWTEDKFAQDKCPTLLPPDDIKVSLLILASFLLKPIAYDPQTNSANQCDDVCTSLLGHVLFW